MAPEMHIPERIPLESKETDFFDMLKNIKQLAILRVNGKEASGALTDKMNRYEKESIESLYGLKNDLDGYISKNITEESIANAMNQIYRELMVSRVKSLNIPSITDYIIYHTFDGDKNKQQELINLLKELNLIPKKAA